MIRFIDEYRSLYGVEPICRVIQIAPSTYYAHEQRRAHPETAPQRVKQDAELMPRIQRVFDENFQVYGYRKVWRQLRREGIKVARCTVARLMKAMGYVANGCAQPFLIRRHRVRSIMSTGCSKHHARTRCGCLILRMFPPGRALFTWRS